MRIHLSCNKCTQSIPVGATGIAYSKVVSLNDSGNYVMECPAGHMSQIVLRTPKHEVLYLIASNAILDGYLREAVLSFSGALERYFEFAIRVLARAKGVSPESLTTAWNLLSKQSERQFGAFVLVWLFEGGELFADVPFSAIQKHAEFRNDVVHKGTIPTLEGCLAYGQHVANVISPFERALQSKYARPHKDECFALARHLGASSSEPLTVLSEFSVLDSMVSQGTPLKELLVRLEGRRTSLGDPPPAAERVIQHSIQVLDV